jgi:hypothetical protein
MFVSLLMGCERNLKNEIFNVYFSFPEGREEYLGQATGLGACGSIAHEKARSLNMSSANWSYVCCLKTSSSECAEKHR